MYFIQACKDCLRLFNLVTLVDISVTISTHLGGVYNGAVQVDLEMPHFQIRPTSNYFSLRKKPPMFYGPFPSPLRGEQTPVHDLPLYSIIPLGQGRRYKTTCLSENGSALSLITPFDFECFLVTITQDDKWSFRRTCEKARYGTKFATGGNAPGGHIIACMSNIAIFIATTSGTCIEVYKLDGNLANTITLQNRCHALRISRSGRLLAVGTAVGVQLYTAAQDGYFKMDGETTVIPVWKRGIISIDESRAINCMTFSPDSRLFSLCTVENSVYTYKIQEPPNDPILQYRLDRKIDVHKLPDSYFGVTALALYMALDIVANKSSHDSTKLLIVAEAVGDSFPAIIYQSNRQYEAVRLMSDGYKHKHKSEHRICSAVLSPGFFGALMLFRDGTVKFANWSHGSEHETVKDVADGERLEEETNETRGTFSLAFLEDGMKALAVDRRGKVLALTFVPCALKK